MKKSALLLVVVSSICLTSCELDGLDDLFPNMLNESYVGQFGGTADFTLYRIGATVTSAPFSVTVAIHSNEYSVNGWGYYLGSFGENDVGFLIQTKSLNVDYSSYNKRYQGTVNFGGQTNSGSITEYTINTDGSQTPNIKFVWSCTRK